MSCEPRVVVKVPVSDVRNFIETNHYSGSINGCKVSIAFAILESGRMVGAALFGQLSTTAWKKYGENENDVIELRRLVCLDSCPRNTESWFIAKCIKMIKKEKKYKVCVSYADPYYNHLGVIYQASNWCYHGMTAKDTVFQTPDGRMYHSRALRTKYKGEFKPFVVRLRKMYDEGTLVKVIVPGKHIYTYDLVGVQKPTKIPYPKNKT